MTQTKVTLFRDDIPEKTWWQWFKNQHPNVVIGQVKGLETCITQGLTTVFCNKFYTNLVSFIIYINTFLITCGTMTK